MKVIKYLCNPHTLAYPSNVSPRTFQLFLFAGSSRYHHHRCRRRKGEGEWKERERGKNWSATRRLRPSWINEARAVPIRFYRFLDTTSRGGRNESASLLAACARNEKLNVSREREGRGGERERGELAKLSSAEDQPTFLGHSTLRRAIFNEHRQLSDIIIRAPSNRRGSGHR